MISSTKKINSAAFRGDTEDQDQSSSSAFSRRSKSCGSSPFRNSSRISFGGGSRRNRRRSSGGGCRSVETHARKRFQTSPDGRGRDAAADAALVAR